MKARLALQAGGQGKGNGLADMVQSYPNSDELSIAEILATTMRSGEGFPNTESRPSSVSPPDVHHMQSFVGSLTGENGASQMAKLASASLDAANIYSHPIPTLASQGGIKEPIDPLLLDPSTGQYKPREDPSSKVGTNLSELILSGWPTDFPSPVMVEQLVRVFFDKSEYLRCLFQPSKFFEQLAHGPNSPRYPSHAILHAIFAIGYALRPDLDPANLSYLATQMGRGTSNDESGMASCKYHCERAREHISKANGQGHDLLSACKAAIIITSIKFGVGDIFEAWVCSGMATKMAIAMALNRGKEDGELTMNKAKVDIFWGSLLAPPANWIEEEERRRVMFLAFVTDQAGAASLLWNSSLKESDIISELPMCGMHDFEQANRAGAPVDGTGQTLQSPNLFTEHRYDSFNTMIKGVLLIGRCGDFISHLPFAATEDHVKVPHWYRLNNLITSFSSSLPFGSITADQAGGRFDSSRLLTTIAIHTCTLQLHEPLARLDENSLNMCRAACTGITNLLRVSSTCPPFLSWGNRVDSAPLSFIFCILTSTSFPLYFVASCRIGRRCYTSIANLCL